ncbi:hypothetical protein QTO34_016823 [Cnephaeus nilssonii]|uniref:SPIN-DOC-like zinc-finger domain-containing protein n=1 Tax=Cnephaeus nilssonii TaxID=3371016 RepID=A0AA40I326_CNENI|nr:hypothetical protein QTO34_016823 [Eptesicus nilssonii]
MLVAARGQAPTLKKAEGGGHSQGLGPWCRQKTGAGSQVELRSARSQTHGWERSGSGGSLSRLLCSTKEQRAKSGVWCDILQMATTQKRKVDAECRSFQEKCTNDYFFVDVKGKPVCLVCGDALAVMKTANLERHHSSKHANLSELGGQMHLDKTSALQRGWNHNKRFH